MQNADLGKRFLAYLIDSVVYFVGAMVIIIPFVVISILMSSTPTESTEGIIVLMSVCLTLFIGLGILGLIFYIWVWYPFKHNGQSIGKQVMKIRIVRATEKPLTLGSYFGRFGIFYLLGLISCITMFFDENKRAIHDMVVDTRVVEA